DDEVLDVDENDVKLIEKLHENIEVLQFRNIIDLEEYIDYSKEKEKIVNLVTNPEPEEDKSNEDDDSTE
ncbi:8550_t:CDS:2, partial [Racocetra fulgida]